MYHQSAIFYLIIGLTELWNLKQSKAQKFLAQFSENSYSKLDAAYALEQIRDHKWYLSENLNRDVGMKVAALDYFENISR